MNDKLKKALITDRHNTQLLPKFLLKHGTYDNLKRILKKNEEIYISKNINKKNYIKNVFEGMIGPKCNKQMAIYELPTLELLESIKSLCYIFNINKIEEMMAGTGLLAKMLSLYLSDSNILINATDGNRCMDTSSNNKYFNVTTKLIVNYIRTHDDKIDDKNKMHIISWPSDNIFDKTNNDTSQLGLFFETVCPAITIIIGEGIKYDNFIENLPDEYITYFIHGKQICYKDYFHLKNKNNQKYNSHSKIYIIVNSHKYINNLDMLNEYNKNLDSLISIIESKIDNTNIFELTKINYLCDLVSYDSLPEWVLSLNDTDLKTFLITLKDISYDPNSGLPSYINSYIDFITYSKIGNIPDCINTNESFIEYSNSIQELTDHSIRIMKKNNILPEWIRDIGDARNFVFLDYATDSKKWKISLDQFLLEFSYY